MNIIEPFASLEARFGDLPEARVMGQRDRQVVEIIIVAICAMWCGAESWREAEELGERNGEWLKQHLEEYHHTTHFRWCSAS